MKVVKKLFVVFWAMACVLMMANHTYASNVIEVTPEIFVNINTEDGDGKTVSGAKMKLYDSEGNLIDSWTSGNKYLEYFLESEYKAGKYYTFYRKISDVVPYPSASNAVLDKVEIYYDDYDSDGYYNESYRFAYDGTYNTTVSYHIQETPVLVVPEGKAVLNVAPEYANIGGSYGIGFSNGSDTLSLHDLKDIAGKQVLYDIPEGTDGIYAKIVGSGGSINHEIISANAQPTYYVKKTINISEYVDYFQENGQLVYKEKVFQPGKEVDRKKILMYIVSGSAINAVVPDSNGNVTIYVDTSSYTAQFCCMLSWVDGTSYYTGGPNSVKMDMHLIDEYTIKTMSVPEQGASFEGLPVGTYTVVQENSVPGYDKPEDLTFTVEADCVMDAVVLVNVRHDGIYKVNGALYYYVDGKVAEDFTGIIENKYVKNGKVDYSYTGLHNDGIAVRYVKKGIYQATYSGLYEEAGIYYIIKDGILDLTCKGLYEVNGEQLYFELGTYRPDFTGFYNEFCVIEGKYAKDFTGILYDIFVVEGRVAYTYTGLYNDGTAVRYIKKGSYQAGYSGLYEEAGIYYIIKDGILDLTCKGLYPVNDKQYYFELGTFRPDCTGLYNDGVAVRYVKNGIYQSDYSGYYEEAGIYYIIKDGILDLICKGLYEVNGEQLYFELGTFRPDYTGIYNNIYVKNGKADYNYTGLYNDGTAVRYVKRGVYQADYSGLYEEAGIYYIIKDGILDLICKGLYEVNGELLYFELGTFRPDYTGLVGEYYVAKGKVNENYTGLVQLDGVWTYITKGKTDYSYTGTVVNGGATWYVIDGVLDGNHTGIRYDGASFWYVVKGKVNTSFVGLYNYADAWWYIKDGRIQTDYKGMVDYSGYTWYVANGKVNTGFTGLGLHNGVWYCVQAGKVNMNYTGLVQNGGSWWYVKNGVLDTAMTGIVETGGSKWLVGTGKLQSGYTGKYTYLGVVYNIVNGKVK